MDRANLALATRAIARGHLVTCITSRADEYLRREPKLRLIKVPRPFGSNVLGEFLLRLRAATEQRLRPSTIVLANGGNHPKAQVSWVHYVHAADRTPLPGHLFRRLYDR